MVTGLPEATLIDLRARVVGLLESQNAAPRKIGVLIGAVIATLASPRAAYAVAGMGALVLVLLALILRPFVPITHPRASRPRQRGSWHRSRLLEQDQKQNQRQSQSPRRSQ